jgi:excisionase family DNA binding protein
MGRPHKSPKPETPSLLSAASRLRGQPGYPKKNGRPRTRPVSEVDPPAAAPTPPPIAIADLTVTPLLIATKVAAAMLGVSRSTVRDLATRGDLPRVTLPGVDRFLFAVEDVHKLVARSRANMNGGHPPE